MNLLMLAPDVQEAILFLPQVESGHDPIREWQVRPVAAEVSWARQRRRWTAVADGTPSGSRPRAHGKLANKRTICASATSA